MFNDSFVFSNNILWLLLALAIGLYFGWSTCEQVRSHDASGKKH